MSERVDDHRRALVIAILDGNEIEVHDGHEWASLGLSSEDLIREVLRTHTPSSYRVRKASERRFILVLRGEGGMLAYDGLFLTLVEAEEAGAGYVLLPSPHVRPLYILELQFDPDSKRVRDYAYHEIDSWRSAA